MRLSDFILANLEPILHEWEAFARTLAPAADTMDVGALRDHAEQMLRAIALDLEQPQSAAQQEAKSKGRAPRERAAPRTAADEHGLGRAEHNFTLGQMISEYRAVRASVLRLLARSKGGAGQVSSDEIMRFHEAIDQALAESAVTFSAELDRSRDLFLGIVGHDLRNPLGAILRSAGTILDVEEPATPAFRAASLILDSARRMKMIIGDLLDLTRLRLGTGARLLIRPAEADLGGIGRQVTEEFAAAHPGREIRFAAQGDVRGRFDEGRIAQALANLVGNALQHGTAEGPITVTARASAGEVLLAVNNRGPVIPADRLRELFELKRGPGAGGMGPHAGLGLGLYITRQIADAHGGTVTAASSDGMGTTFTIRLPTNAPDT